jgi:hypothetical protein
MEQKDVYTQWKDYRRHVPVPEDFSSGVMAAIERRVFRNDDELPDAMALLSSRLKRWSVAAALVLLGIGRIAFITVNLLRANPLAPY